MDGRHARHALLTGDEHRGRFPGQPSFQVRAALITASKMSGR
jgi:hypothetical protein